MSPYIRRMVAKYADSSANSPTSINKDNNKLPTLLYLVQGEEKALRGCCLRHQGDIHIVASPINEIANMSLDPRILRIEARECNKTISLDDAYKHINIMPAWEGATDLPQAFKGKGTVIGLGDIGFDLTHPAFRDNEGKLRISRFWDYLNNPKDKTYNMEDPYPIGKFFDNKDAILQQTSSIDSKISYHGTHTLGIATGNDWGTGLQGMAPEADIYLINEIVEENISLLPEELREYYNDTIELLGFQYMYDYADEQQKPCVISFSIGGIQSVTDGDMLFSEYLSRMTEKEGHIFVASVGNGGKDSGYMPKRSNETIVGGAISTKKGSLFPCISTNGNIILRITNYALKTPVSKEIQLDMPLSTAEVGQTSPSGLIYGETNRIQYDNDFDGLIVEIFPMKDCYRKGRMGYDLKFSEGNLIRNSGYFVMEIIGEGVEADIFMQNGSIKATEFNPNLNGAIEHSGNILRPGCLKPAIGVGATGWKTSYTNIDGIIIENNKGENGNIADFSGCGPAVSGITKPDIIGPGTNVSSAANSFCQQLNKSKITKEITFEDKTYQWMCLDGTSMSTPMIAGTIALWLEADPSLTRERIMDVFAHTAMRHDHTLSYPNNCYGYGEIDAYKGLLYILNVSHIKEISQNHIRNTKINIDEMGKITINFPSSTTSEIPLSLYIVGGQKISSTIIPAGTSKYTHFIPQKGIIIVQVGNMGSTIVRIP